MLNSRKKIFSWAMYDWANSAFATTVMAGFFPLFFKEYWSNPNNVEESTFYLGMANSIAGIIVAVIAPFLGAVADKGSAKKKFLSMFMFLGVIMTAALWMVASGNWQMAVLFYVSAAVGFSGSNIFYDSLITGVSSKEKINFTSSLGYALGYIGGGLLFLVNVLMYLYPEFFGIPGKAEAIKISFLTVAVWWAVFSIPIFLFVDEPFVEDTVSFKKAFGHGLKQLIDTFREISHLKIVGLFLLSYWLYIDGVDTIIRMAVDYGLSLGFPTGSLITALLLVQFVAFPAALVYSWIASKIGTKRSLLIAVFGYAIITLFAFFISQEWHFYGLAVAIALLQGGIQALSRSLYSRIIPVNKSAQFFGFYNMLGKFAVVIGPFMVGMVTITTNSNRSGFLSIILLFLLGGFLLLKVNVKEGERIAKENL